MTHIDFLQDIFIKQLRKLKVIYLLGFIGYLIAALVPFLCWIFSALTIFLALPFTLAFLSIAVGYFFLWSRNLEHNQAWRTILHHSFDIVWIYTVKIGKSHNSFGEARNQRTSFLYLGLMNGKKYRIAMPTSHEKDVLNALKTLAPQATFGFDSESNKNFKVNPHLLRMSNPPSGVK